MGYIDAMAERYPANLGRGEWRDALRELALDCADGDHGDARDCVREMNALLHGAPNAALPEGLLPLSPARLHALLDAEASDSAVLAMLDRGVGYMLSRSGDGQSLATVALPGAYLEKSAAGVSPTLALIGALALSLSSATAAPRSKALRDRPTTRLALH